MYDKETLEKVWEGNIIAKVIGETEDEGQPVEARFVKIKSENKVTPGDTLIVSVEASTSLIPSDLDLMLINVEDEEVAKITGSLDKITSLNPVEFDWIASGEHCNAGFVAQEVETILKFMKMEAPKYKTNFSVDEAVKIIEGPFANFLGTVDKIDDEKGKVIVLVSIFGRETPVELDFLQVSKI